ncbi:hypothetical protein RAS1_34670 [Phycisphaerae bacterium RAS1]|nr:hypothetical protein RAS1_34670 [Phycisphaerae bacterium RAS1]
MTRLMSLMAMVALAILVTGGCSPEQLGDLESLLPAVLPVAPPAGSDASGAGRESDDEAASGDVDSGASDSTGAPAPADDAADGPGNDTAPVEPRAEPPVADDGATTPNDGGGAEPPAPPAELKTVVPRLFSTSHTVTSQVSETLYLAAIAVYRASMLNGGMETYTGTLTYHDPNDGRNCSYAPTPTDRLCVVVVSGSPTEYTINQLTGWQREPESHYGFWEHSADFTVRYEDKINVYIVSQAVPVASGKSQWQRRIMGKTFDERGTLELDLTHAGDWDNTGSDSYAGFLFHKRNETAEGVIRGGGATIEVHEQYSFLYAFQNTPYVRHLFQYGIQNASTVRVGETGYALDGVYVRWEKQSANGAGEALYNVVGEPGYWTCGGRLVSDGQTVGQVEFDGPVVDGSHGPDLVLRMSSGESVVLHPLIVP